MNVKRILPVVRDVLLLLLFAFALWLAYRTGVELAGGPL
jgi:hypothetical protein